MAYVPERPTPGSSHGAYLETKDAVYHLISCLEGLLPRITSRRERREMFELMSRLERILIEIVLAEEFDEQFWSSGEIEAADPSLEDRLGHVPPNGGTEGRSASEGGLTRGSIQPNGEHEGEPSSGSNQADTQPDGNPDEGSSPGG
jgi:hypothetical protein